MFLFLDLDGICKDMCVAEADWPAFLYVTNRSAFCRARRFVNLGNRIENIAVMTC